MKPHLATLIAIFCCLGGAAAGAPAPITDDFSRYRAGSDATEAWETGSFGWEVRDGRFESDGIGRAFALPTAAPHGRRLVVEATVIPRRSASSKEWKIAGLAIMRDERNYWHLAFVESPEPNGARHFVELQEMLDGNWLANTGGDSRLENTLNVGGDFQWEYDRPYRLRLEITQEGIEGTVSELDGTQRTRLGFAFGARAVTSGRPALTTGNLATAFDDFAVTYHEEAPPPPKPVRPAYVGPGAGPVRGKMTGFFHVERIDGRWWMIDPNGDAYYVVGTDHVNYYAHWCEKLGYAPYSRNVQAKFGSEERWAASAAERLKAWGFNSLGAGCGASVRYRGLAYTEFLSLGTGFVGVSDIAPREHWTGFPDVFHPRFAAYCEWTARRMCAPLRDDPWLLGYFLDNELEWYGKNGSETGLVDETFKKPADHPAKRALVRFLQRRYGTITRLNRAWGTQLPGFSALLQSRRPIVTQTAAGQRDRRDFVRLIAERYFAITTAAIRKADPNHLILGCRFAGNAPGIWDIAGKYLDIVSVNYYGRVDLERGLSPDMPAAMARYHAQSRRPLMITEWSFPALDAGLPCQHGAGQRVATQTEKARCYAIYQRALFSMPFMVGSDYFMWVDEPALGISSTFPEDSNYGLVDVNDDAWPELTQTATRVNRLALQLHAGQTAELSGEIRPAGEHAVLRVRNRGKVAARCPVRFWVQGKEGTAWVSVDPGGHQDVPLRLDGPSFVAAVIDPEDSILETEETDNQVERALFGRARGGPSMVVINPSAEALRDVPLALPLGRRGVNWRVVDAAGHPVPAQIDLLPGGAELALRLPMLPARSLVTLRLQPGAAPLSQREVTGDRSFVIDGPLRLEHDAGSGNLLDRVLLGDLLLGRYALLIHQLRQQPLWVPPDRVEQVETHTGPVRTVVLLTAGLEAPETSPAKTAVDAQGSYASQEQRAARYRARVRLNCYAGERWFGARFLGVQNTDSRTWRCQAYFHYPASAIGGRAEDDQPAGGSDTPWWQDEGVGACYGAVVDTTRLTVHFWKDTPDGAAQHPDIWRELRRDLQPGARVEAGADDAEVLLFGAYTTPETPGGEALARLRALARVRAEWHGRR